MQFAVLVFTIACSSACSSTTPSGQSTDASNAGDDATPDAPAVETVADPCPATPPACPEAPAGLVRGSGLHAIDRCAFPLALDPPASPDDLIDALPPTLTRVTLADVTADLNRVGPKLTTALPGTAPGVVRAYEWQSGDESVTYWTPQGVTGSFDGVATGVIAGRKIVLVSWYYTMANDTGSTVDKGVRLAIVDATDPASIRYRFALLVEPSGTRDAPSFTAVPVHAGGLAWVGDRLYVPVTGSGFRVFDLSRMFKVDSLDDRIGLDPATGTYAAYSYAYAIPQIARYRSTGACAPVFSFVALDRTTPTPTLVSGEYSAATITGRLYRWPLDSHDRLQLTDRARIVPDGAWLESEQQIQGAFAENDTWWLSSSRPAAGAGELVRTTVDAPSTTLGWSNSPEDLARDPQLDAVWSLSEGLNARYLFAVDRKKL